MQEWKEKKDLAHENECQVLLFARHGRALMGESPEHAQATRKCIAEQQAV